jgi:hypothetical protein
MNDLNICALDSDPLVNNVDRLGIIKAIVELHHDFSFNVTIVTAQTIAKTLYALYEDEKRTLAITMEDGFTTRCQQLKIQKS